MRMLARLRPIIKPLPTSPGEKKRVERRIERYTHTRTNTNTHANAHVCIVRLPLWVEFAGGGRNRRPNIDEREADRLE